MQKLKNCSRLVWPRWKCPNSFETTILFDLDKVFVIFGFEIGRSWGRQVVQVRRTVDIEILKRKRKFSVSLRMTPKLFGRCCDHIFHRLKLKHECFCWLWRQQLVQRRENLTVLLKWTLSNDVIPTYLINLVQIRDLHNLNFQDFYACISQYIQYLYYIWSYK